MITTYPPIAGTTSTTSSAPWTTQVARGLVPGAATYNIFAFSAAVGGTISTLWDATPTAYAFPASASVMTFASTSASDNTSAKVLVTGLDSTFSLLTETVTLNGVTGVNTVGSFLRINTIALIAPGSGQTTNIGTITAKVGATTYAQMNPTVARSQNGFFTIPLGYSLYLYDITGFSGDGAATNKYITFQARLTDNGLAVPVTRTLTQTTFINNYLITRSVPLKYTEKTDVQWQVSASAGTQQVCIIGVAILISNTAT